MLVPSSRPHSWHHGAHISNLELEYLAYAGIGSDWTGFVELRVLVSSVSFGLLQRPTGHA